MADAILGKKARDRASWHRAEATTSLVEARLVRAGLAEQRRFVAALLYFAPPGGSEGSKYANGPTIQSARCRASLTWPGDGLDVGARHSIAAPAAPVKLVCVPGPIWSTEGRYGATQPRAAYRTDYCVSHPSSSPRTLDFENQLIVMASRRTDDRQPSSEQHILYIRSVYIGATSS